MDKQAIVVIATKNRPTLFKNAIDSVYKQTKKPKEIVVVSDSTKDNRDVEDSIIQDYPCTLLIDQYEHNYAGSLNTAIDYIVRKKMIESKEGINGVFIAFLDDDDSWRPTYLEKCLAKAKNDTDFVVSGLYYRTNEKSFPISIPTTLDRTSFLAVNPHIQGSNTFVQLKTLLKAGCFDENMSSTTDRDIFTRILMLNPKYEVVDEALVDIDARTNRERLTTLSNGKKESLSKFYSKYGGMMSKEIELAFFERTNRYSPLNLNDIKHSLSFDVESSEDKEKKISFDKRIVVCSIVSDIKLGIRLLGELKNQKYKKFKVILIANFLESIKALDKAVKEIQLDSVKIISLGQLRNDLKDVYINEYVRPNSLKNKTITDIAAARTYLHYYAKKESKDGDVIWILDDDMELSSLVRKNGKFVKKHLDLRNISAKYLGKVDVVVGSYSLDAPLPTLSTIRTNLLDYVYSKKLNKNSIYDYSLFDRSDYYYDESDATHKHLETPLPLLGVCSLDNVFSGKAISRPLFVIDENTEFAPYSRGGNTIVYNRKVLDIPNMSITFGNTIARRSDYFWVQQAIKYGYKVIGSSYSTLHNRVACQFDYHKEAEKSLKDLLGSSFTKAFSKLKDNTRESFYSLFIDELKHRLTRFIDSYYRIIGLLEISEEQNKYNFDELGLEDYIRRALQFTGQPLVESSFDYLMSLSNKYCSSLKIPAIQSALEESLLVGLSFVGHGNEGAVFKDDKYIYKIFYDFFDDSVIKRYGSVFGECQQLENVTSLMIGQYFAVRYLLHKKNKPYLGGYSAEIVSLLHYFKNLGLVLTNIKRDNFLICDGKLKFIDYGKNIEKYTPEKWDMSVERLFEMLKYSTLSLAEFKQIVSMSHLHEADAINFGIGNLKKLLEYRTKEKIHDDLIVSLIRERKPKTMLDYGAGKCKIANQLSSEIRTSVFDIDIETMKKRANEKTNIVENIEKDKTEYDLVNSNLVLCCVDNKLNDYIVKQIHKHLNDNGDAVISFCNPFFTDIQRTENRTKGREEPYVKYSEFEKETIYGHKKEYHRPFYYYENLFRRNGFYIDKIIQDDGVAVDTLESISEHIIFVLKKIKFVDLNDCTLMIKCNPMEWKTIKRNIIHIINQLEFGCSFQNKMIIVDGDKEDRNRRYSNDDKTLLIEALNELQYLGYINSIMWCDNLNGFESYKKWFGNKVINPYSNNGQQLLSSIKGFDLVKTRYVFQTDSDIIYSNQKFEFSESFNEFKESNAVTGSLSIYHAESCTPTYGERTEVRSCFLDIKKLNNKLPLPNAVVKDAFELPWHKSLDNVLTAQESIRFHSNTLFFIHPENEKKNCNYILSIANLVEKCDVFPIEQINKVNLCGSPSSWFGFPKQEMVLFIRGYDTPIVKLHRLFDSLKRQDYQKFNIIYVDDASREEVSEYARMVLRYDCFFKDRTIALFNDTRVDSLANFDFVIKNIINNPNAIIVNIDSDDCLLTNDSLSIIKKEFDLGADLTVGNCFRTDKPLKHYQVESFKESWLRAGDNIWLHPKCFRRYLCNYIQDNLLISGKYIKVCTDYAIMLPLVEHAKKPKFIDKQIYYFEPSNMNVKKIQKYRNDRKKEIMNILFERAKEDHTKKIVAVIGDGGVLPGSEKYELAYQLGKALVDNGYKVQTGGLGGIMEAALKGAKMSSIYTKGDTIAILPSSDEKDANDYADVIIPTGLDIMRNAKVVDADAVIAIGGGAGTLSEISIAWQLFRLIIGFNNVDGWSKELSEKKLDKRVRYEEIPNDCVYGVSDINKCIKLLNNNVGIYTRVHTQIKWRKE